MYLPDSIEERETTWYCYAWPVEKDVTGIRVIVFSSYEHFMASNSIQEYSGDKVPKHDAALSKEHNFIRSGHIGRDGEMWVT